MSDKRALKPCPFCGGQAKEIFKELGNAYIECLDCLSGTNVFETIGFAIKAWNTRTEKEVQLSRDYRIFDALNWYRCHSLHPEKAIEAMKLFFVKPQPAEEKCLCYEYP